MQPNGLKHGALCTSYPSMPSRRENLRAVRVSAVVESATELGTTGQSKYGTLFWFIVAFPSDAQALADTFVCIDPALVRAVGGTVAVASVDDLMGSVEPRLVVIIRTSASTTAAGFLSTSKSRLRVRLIVSFSYGAACFMARIAVVHPPLSEQTSQGFV